MAVVEMASYEEDGMVGMMGRVGKDVTTSSLEGSWDCFQTARDQNIPYMAGGGSGELRKTRTNVI